MHVEVLLNVVLVLLLRHRHQRCAVGLACEAIESLLEALGDLQHRAKAERRAKFTKATAIQWLDCCRSDCPLTSAGILNLITQVAVETLCDLNVCRLSDKHKHRHL